MMASPPPPTASKRRRGRAGEEDGKADRDSQADLAETSPPRGRLPPCSRARRAPRADPRRPHHRRCGPSPAAASGDGEGGEIRGGRRRRRGLGFRPPVALEEATRGGGGITHFLIHIHTPAYFLLLSFLMIYLPSKNGKGPDNTTP
jgi:hypothetical protein